MVFFLWVSIFPSSRRGPARGSAPLLHAPTVHSPLPCRSGPDGTYNTQVLIWSTTTLDWVRPGAPLAPKALFSQPTWCPHRDQSAISPLRRSCSTFSRRSHPLPSRLACMTMACADHPSPSRRAPLALPSRLARPAACNERVRTLSSRTRIHLYPPPCLRGRLISESAPPLICL